MYPENILVFLTSSESADVVRYTAVSGFVFLRFFAPAILNPKLFALRPENPVSCYNMFTTTLTTFSKFFPDTFSCPVLATYF